MQSAEDGSHVNEEDDEEEFAEATSDSGENLSALAKKISELKVEATGEKPKESEGDVDVDDLDLDDLDADGDIDLDDDEDVELSD